LAYYPPVLPPTKQPRRTTPLDKRISYGCINVPAKFFDNVVRPAFTGTNGIVYVLPETRLAREVFASYDVEEHARLQTASQPVPAQVASGAARHCVWRPARPGTLQQHPRIARRALTANTGIGREISRVVRRR